MAVNAMRVPAAALVRGGPEPRPPAAVAEGFQRRHVVAAAAAVQRAEQEVNGRHGQALRAAVLERVVTVAAGGEAAHEVVPRDDDGAVESAGAAELDQAAQIDVAEDIELEFHGQRS